MPRLTLPGAVITVAALVVILLFLLIFSFRDTIRGIAEFFDQRAIRRFFRKPWRAISIAVGLALLIGLPGLLLPEPGVSLWTLLGLAPLIVAPSLTLAWLVLSDLLQCTSRRKRNR